MKFSEKVTLFLDELEAHTVEPVEGVAIEVVRERWIPLIHQLEEELAEHDAYYRKVVDDECAPDEVHCTCVPALRDKIDQLEAENEALRRKAQQVVDRAHGGEFDKFSGYDDYVVPYQLIDELAEALLTGESDGQTNVTV